MLEESIFLDTIEGNEKHDTLPVQVYTFSLVVLDLGNWATSEGPSLISISGFWVQVPANAHPLEA